MNEYIIKDIELDRIEEALALVKNVFIEFNAPDYTSQGKDEFINQIIENETFRNKFKTGEQIMIGAFSDSQIIGVLAISIRNHISLVFVDKKYHRLGIASKLFDEILSRLNLKNQGYITLNSSPYAVAFYEKLGFVATDTEQTKNGIKYTPMELQL